MDRHKTRVMEALDRADRWFDENGVIFSANTALDTQHQALKASIARAKQHATRLDARFAPKVMTCKDQDTFRRRIVVQLRDVAQLARRLRNTVPGIGALVAPKHRTGATSFLTSAESFMDKAAIYAQVLIEHGMSPDFVTSIKAELEQLEDVLTTRAAARSDQVTAKVSLARNLKDGRAVLDIMDVGISRALRDSDPGKLAGWKAAKRSSAARTPRVDKAAVTSPTTHAA